MTAATFVIGDVRDTLAAIPDGTVDLVLTSPPFWKLRSYLPADHIDKHLEIGSEPTPAAFIDTLLALSAEFRRVLAPHGSICVEIGDTYAGSGGAGGDYAADGLRAGQQAFSGSARSNLADDTPMDKSLCLIPELYRVALAYGRNPLTGVESPAGRWRVRNNVRWVRPNPPVGALGDKFRPGTSDMVIATIARDRYFDLDAVRGDPVEPKMMRVGVASASKGVSGGDSGNPEKERMSANAAGAPPLDWWQVSTEAYAGSHYATWPRKLLERPIKAMCPERVCRTCGEPSRRIVDITRAGEPDDAGRDPAANGARLGVGLPPERGWQMEHTTLGFTDCGHNDYRTGLVLDPFGGSGTTGVVATGFGRDALLIDLDERNADLALDRVGPLLLTVKTLDEWKVAA